MICCLVEFRSRCIWHYLTSRLQQRNQTLAMTPWRSLRKEEELQLKLLEILLREAKKGFDVTSRRLSPWQKWHCLHQFPTAYDSRHLQHEIDVRIYSWEGLLWWKLRNHQETLAKAPYLAIFPIYVDTERGTCTWQYIHKVASVECIHGLVDFICNWRAATCKLALIYVKCSSQ